jgi:hypothetical protein
VLPYPTNDLERYAAEFAAIIPTETYSIAQIQGYLLTKKHDPAGAVEGAGDWIVAQQTERRALLEAKRRWRAELLRWQRGLLEESSRGMEAWERVMGEFEEKAAPMETGNRPSTGSPVFGGGPADIVDVLVG